MSGIDIAQATLSAYEAGQATTLASLLTDDMTFSGPVPQPLPKQGFLAVAAASVVAMPDWHFNAHDWQESGNTASATLGITGTHTGTLAIVPNVPPVPPTGTHVQIPAERITFTLRGDQISAIAVDTPPGGGVPAIYAQVGAPLPPTP